MGVLHTLLPKPLHKFYRARLVLSRMRTVLLENSTTTFASRKSSFLYSPGSFAPKFFTNFYPQQLHHLHSKPKRQVRLKVTHPCGSNSSVSKTCSPSCTRRNLCSPGPLRSGEAVKPPLVKSFLETFLFGPNQENVWRTDPLPAYLSSLVTCGSLLLACCSCLKATLI